MQDDRAAAEQEMRAEAEQLTGGPGVVATRSQMRGTLAGTLAFGVIGAVIGLVVGAIFFQGALGTIVSTVAFAGALATFGGVAGGFVGPRRSLSDTPGAADTDATND